MILYIVAAVLPAAVLMYFVYKQDKIEKEPMDLLLKCALSGLYAAVLSIVLEMLFEGIMSNFSYSSVTSYAIATAVMVAAVEEFAKIFFLKRRTWKSPHFNYLFDGVVYAVFVSLGFAAIENVLYVFQYGLSIAIARAALAVPAHFGFSVMMGVFYSLAKRDDLYGSPAGMRRNMLLAYFIPVVMHSIYDACALSESDTAMIIFFIFVVIMDIVVYKTIKKKSRNDQSF